MAGSTANDGVRDYLVGALEGLGLRPSVQDTVGREAGGAAMARVRNVVATLAGSAPTGRVFLVAHYDSVQVGPGANDDGAGVAALLETGGPVIMFETSPGNARLVGVFGRAAPHPVGTSFAVEVYRILPNDTDFSVFLRTDGFGGLNSSYIDGSAAYHTPEDTASRMDRGSLQAHGDNALGLARAFGAADLPALARPAGADATYFPVPGFLLRYPGRLVWPLAVLALLAVVALAWLARRRGPASWPRLAAGFGLALIPLLVAPVAAQLLWLLLVAVRPGYANMIDPWRPLWYRLAVVALTAAVLSTWYGLSRRRVGSAALAVGALGWLALLGVALAALAPGGSYLAALPALAGAAGGLVALVLRDRPVAQVAGLTVGAAVAVVILAPTAVLFFPALGLATAGAGAFVAVLLGLALLPVLEWLYPARPGRLAGAAPATTAAALALACTVAGLVVDRFDPAHPAPAQLMYAMDAGTGRAFWASTEAEPGAWTRRYVTGRQDLGTEFPVLGSGSLATGPATVADLPAPRLEAVSDTTSEGRRTVTVRVRPQRTVRMIYLSVDGGVVSATVEGRPVPVRDGRLGVLFHAPGPDGIGVTLTVNRTGPVSVRIMDGSDGLAGLPGYTPRPADVGVKGSHSSELVVVARTYVIP